jgi:DNA-binding LacI/PurR family transcriptional regulator
MVSTSSSSERVEMQVRKTVSIQDIAQAAGVSHTTVSRALKDNPLISAEVREHIQELAREMGYIPNAVAQSLRGQHTGTVGVVVTTIGDPFFSRVVRGIEEVARRENLSIFLSISNNDPERELAVIETFHRRRVDGIIVADSRLTEQYEKRLVKIHVPAVLINHQAEAQLEYLHSVSSDDYAGSRAALEYLLSLGHRAIGFLGAASRPRSNRIRMQAYSDALHAAGISPKAEWMRADVAQPPSQSDDVLTGRRFLPELIRTGATAVFCYNDMIATGALLACRELGIQVPADLSLVGFDDIELAQYVTPPLTTVHQPKLRLGQVAMQMLLDLLSGQPTGSSLLPANLVIRESCRRVAEELAQP